MKEIARARRALQNESALGPPDQGHQKKKQDEGDEEEVKYSRPPRDEKQSKEIRT